MVIASRYRNASETAQPEQPHRNSENPIGQPGNGAKLQALTELSAPPPALIGSGWDVAPTAPAPPLSHHLAEWSEGSAVAAELAAANLVSLSGAAVIE
ncbi:MAG: hypothetical protein ACK53L_09575, partial [Pirellulaceae bacterium]